MEFDYGTLSSENESLPDTEFQQNIILPSITNIHPSLQDPAMSQTKWFNFNTTRNNDIPQCSENPWYPFPSETFALLYILVHSQQVPFSRSQLEGIWFILQKLSSLPIPSLSSVLRFRQHIPAPAVIHATTNDADKKPYYHLNVCDLLRMELAKPISASNLQEHGQVIYHRENQENQDPKRRLYQQPWTGDKCCLTPTLQPPVYIPPSQPNLQIWFGDILPLNNCTNQNAWGIFCGQHDEVYSDSVQRILHFYPLKCLENRVFEVHNETHSLAEHCIQLPAKNLIGHYYPSNQYPLMPGMVTIMELDTNSTNSSQNIYIPISLEHLQKLYPIHPIKETLQRIDSSLSIRTVNISLWQDGLSGNRSKKWNPHEYTLLSFPGLPLEVSIIYFITNSISSSQLYYLG
ncbi:hypothetical protein HOY82DRAFT_537098 [Tuber indicum]|nr:hypothetical protein HOY82DRAFT_537098 [Tuber indicum]